MQRMPQFFEVIHYIIIFCLWHGLLIKLIAVKFMQSASFKYTLLKVVHIELNFKL